jgi:hypothetical protein
MVLRERLAGRAGPKCPVNGSFPTVRTAGISLILDRGMTVINGECTVHEKKESLKRTSTRKTHDTAYWYVPFIHFPFGIIE